MQLPWAFRLRDHRRKAKQVIRDEMLSRGVTEVEISSWAPPERDLIVPLSRPVAVPFPNYLQTMKWRRRAFAVIRYNSLWEFHISDFVACHICIISNFW